MKTKAITKTAITAVNKSAGTSNAIEQALDRDDITGALRNLIKKFIYLLDEQEWKGIKPTDLISLIVLYKDALTTKNADSQSDIDKWLK